MDFDIWKPFVSIQIDLEDLKHVDFSTATLIEFIEEKLDLNPTQASYEIPIPSEKKRLDSDQFEPLWID